MPASHRAPHHTLKPPLPSQGSQGGRQVATAVPSPPWKPLADPLLPYCTEYTHCIHPSNIILLSPTAPPLCTHTATILQLLHWNYYSTLQLLQYTATTTVHCNYYTLRHMQQQHAHSSNQRLLAACSALHPSCILFPCIVEQTPSKQAVKRSTARPLPRGRTRRIGFPPQKNA